MTPKQSVNNTVARWLERGSMALIGVLGALVPAVFLLIQIQYERGTLASVASTRAFLVSQHVSRNPLMWRFEEHRLIEYIANGILGQEADDHRWIVDEQEVVLVENGLREPLLAPVLRVEALVHDAGRPVGKVIVERSIRPLWVRSGWLALGSLGVAGLLIALLHYLPIRALRRAEADMRYRAEHDLLTGLPNREHFRVRLRDAVDEAGRRHGALAVLFIDLDRFKTINDNFGHDTGDMVLREIAGRLASESGARALPARLSGDEFALLLTDAPADLAAAVAQTLVIVCAQPIVVGANAHQVGCCIGVACYPEDARVFDDLLAFADTAMLHAKRAGRGQWRRYDADMQKALHERSHLEADLRSALARSEFELHYQPLQDLASGRVRAVEALLRWRHPVRGLVPPVQFISVLEEMGLIQEVGRWVIDEAIRQSLAWEEAGVGALTVAVNVSPLQFAQGDEFIATLREVLDRRGLAPARLQLELTEGLLMSNVDTALALMRQFQAIGVSIAIDDFGTGYSSLAYLRTFPVDTLKIDRSFVRDLDAPGGVERDVLVHTIIQLGHNLGMKVTAEGIESAELLPVLRAMGCDTGQGFYLRRPLPPDVLQAQMLDQSLPGEAVRLWSTRGSVAGTEPLSQADVAVL
jgi:diguanylate cyclase (GGDEF)-like protein